MKKRHKYIIFPAIFLILLFTIILISLISRVSSDTTNPPIETMPPINVNPNSPPDSSSNNLQDSPPNYLSSNPNCPPCKLVKYCLDSGFLQSPCSASNSGITFFSLQIPVEEVLITENDFKYISLEEMQKHQFPCLKIPFSTIDNQPNIGGDFYSQSMVKEIEDRIKNDPDYEFYIMALFLLDGKIDPLNYNNAVRKLSLKVEKITEELRELKILGIPESKIQKEFSDIMPKLLDAILNKENIDKVKAIPLDKGREYIVDYTKNLAKTKATDFLKKIDVGKPITDLVGNAIDGTKIIITKDNRPCWKGTEITILEIKR